MPLYLWCRVPLVSVSPEAHLCWSISLGCRNVVHDAAFLYYLYLQWILLMFRSGREESPSQACQYIKNLLLFRSRTIIVAAAAARWARRWWWPWWAAGTAGWWPWRRPWRTALWRTIGTFDGDHNKILHY